MKRIAMLVLSLVAVLATFVPAVMAGGPDGVRFQLWDGVSSEPMSKDVQFADCTLGTGVNDFGHDTDLYVQMDTVRYGSYDRPYPTDEWSSVSWFVLADVQQPSTLRFWADNALNPSINFTVHGVNKGTGDIVFHSPITGIMQTLALTPGRFQFTATATKAAAVPEPGSLALLLVAGSGLLCMRRRQ